MSNTINEKLNALRRFMEEKDLHAFIIPSTDAHLSEYPALHWASRVWISGFTGSAGTVVVTRQKAGLWTDSRYFLQGANEIKDTEIQLFKDGLPTTPSIEEWLTSVLAKGENIGIDGSVYAAKEALNLTHKLNMRGLHVVSDYDPFGTIWHDRPEIPKNPIFVMPEIYAGESARQKIDRICDNVEKNGNESLLVASLDTIAWIFNIRGNDVKCNPVAVSYAYISRKETVLFVDPEKLTNEVSAYLKNEGVILAEYNKIYDYVSKINTRICLDANKVTLKLYNAIAESRHIADMPSPADLMKSIKNQSEIQGFNNALERDGVAMVRFLMWLEEAVPEGNVTEISISEKLVEYRSRQENYVGESFDTIAGYGPNGAIVHYHASAESSLAVKPEGLLLVDSGAQYFDGTTDITRTVAVGPLSEQMKKDYTMVLKGHIGIATAIYPQGTRGTQLDILARKSLWDNGLNFLHGTGHGIGHFLNVHEGPQSIRMNENPTTLQIGMVTSNEPGLYRAGKYGIRIENLVLTQHETTTDFGDFYSFRTLTLCPIDTTPILKEMLTDSEISWFNAYHRLVYDRLLPLLTNEEKSWLKEKRMKYNILIVLSLLFILKAEAQNNTNKQNTDFQLEVNIPSQSNHKIYFGRYWKGATYATDSVLLSDQGKATFDITEELPSGQYFLFIKPSFQVDLLLGDKQNKNIQITVDENDLSRNSVSGSRDTELLWAYLMELDKLRLKKFEIEDQLEDSTISTTDHVALHNQLEKLDGEMEAYTDSQIKKYKDEWFSVFVKGTTPISFPNTEMKTQSDFLENKAYGKAHFFDNINMEDPRLWRTNYLHSYMDSYMQQWTDKVPDSLAYAAKRLVEKSKGNDFTFKEMLSDLTNKSLKSDVMGDESIWALLFEDYILDKDIPWIDSTQMSTLRSMYEYLRHNRIGMTAQNLTLKTMDGKEVDTNEIKADYTLLYFYDPSCGHCMTEIPILHDSIYAKYKDKGFEVMAIDISSHKETREAFVQKHNLSDWVNAADPDYTSKYWMYYDTSGVPSTYILDKNKIIIAKKINLENIKKILEFYIQDENGTN